MGGCLAGSRVENTLDENDQDQGYIQLTGEEKVSNPAEDIVLQRETKEEKHSGEKIENAKSIVSQPIVKDGKWEENKEVPENAVRRRLEEVPENVVRRQLEEKLSIAPSSNPENPFQTKEGEHKELESVVGRQLKEEVRIAPSSHEENALPTRVSLKPFTLNKRTNCKVVIVYSTYGITSHEEQSIRRSINFFEVRKFPLEYVDAAIVSCQDRRAIYEKVSGLKCWWAPKFPQIFIRLEDETAVYVGDWDRIQELLDSDGLNRVFIKQNKIPTFSAVFGHFLDTNYVKSDVFPNS